MRLTLTTNDGEVIDYIDEVEGWDLTKPMGASNFARTVHAMLPDSVWRKERDKLLIED